MKDSVYLPKTATITRIEEETPKEKLFNVKLDNGQRLGHKPGQFVELSVFGVGEAPFSITSSPTKPGGFELCVRATGDVTNALHGMNVGDRIGIRGPFGNGFDLDFLKGKDLLFIGGGIGIVPLRSMINYVFDKREDFGKVTILYGCKEPCELLFGVEVNQWSKRPDVEHHLTVDKCPEGECWEGNIGVITTLIPNVHFDIHKTFVLVVGPPIMYKFVLESLKEKDMPDDHIMLSFERHMKCGLGKCGHCQINAVYVCREGPVFNYAKLKHLPEAF